MIPWNLKSQSSENGGYAQRGWLDGTRKGRKTVIVRGRRARGEETETLRRRIRSPGQTKNHGVSFVSEGARDARMNFRRKFVVCWAEAVTRIQSS